MSAVSRAAKGHPFTPRHDGIGCRVTVDVVDYRPVECGKRPDEDPHDGTRCPPPDLEFPLPPCSICGRDCDYDDGPYCTSCGVSWSPNGTAGTWHEPSLKACRSTHKPFDRDYLPAEYEGIRHFVNHCILADGHDEQHRSDDLTVWADHQEVDQ